MEAYLKEGDKIKVKTEFDNDVLLTMTIQQEGLYEISVNYAGKRIADENNQNITIEKE